MKIIVRSFVIALAVTGAIASTYAKPSAAATRQGSHPHERHARCDLPAQRSQWLRLRHLVSA